MQISRFTVKSYHTELSWEFSEVNDSTFIMLSRRGRCRFEDSTSSQTKNYFLRVSTFTLIVPSNAGAHLKIQMSIRPCNIHHCIKMQVQTSKFKCRVRPYRVTCTRCFLLGMSHQINIHTHNHPYSQHYRHCPPAPTIIAACLSHYIRRVVNPFQNVNLLWCQQF